MSQLEHKGYVGAAELSEEDGVFHGKLAFLRDLVTYESSTAKGLAKAFRDAVDDYLADCKAEGREPDKPFKGQFNVRTRPELHRAYASIAAARGQSLNEVVTDALEKALPKMQRR
ncbi:MAG TPA: type II toxin-antitoxin system HicB family antitoxin [Vitreimonas sp.]|jgi:predicted HicB family RNase H-like nuclease|nr:type II toxin-antitoxin system HicB family antitoxin [Vitreimonas sp.]